MRGPQATTRGHRSPPTPNSLGGGHYLNSPQGEHHKPLPLWGRLREGYKPGR